MQTIDRISLHLTDTSISHGNLVLTLGDREWVCDSYYLLLDPELMPEREDADKVRAVLRRLLQQWNAALAELADQSMCYLPYDFSDQYTAWLRCRRNKAAIHVQRGWSPAVCGHELAPSEIGEYLRDVPDYRLDGDEVVISQEAFVASIEHLLAAL